MLERIEKCLGYHVALYACEMGEMGDLYLGHYKVFANRPRSFWEHGHLAADTVNGLSSSVERALNHAQDQAKQKIRTLPARQLSPVTALVQQAKRCARRSRTRALRAHSDSTLGAL